MSILKVWWQKMQGLPAVENTYFPYFGTLISRFSTVWQTNCEFSLFLFFGVIFGFFFVVTQALAWKFPWFWTGAHLEVFHALATSLFGFAMCLTLGKEALLVALHGHPRPRPNPSILSLGSPISNERHFLTSRRWYLVNLDFSLHHEVWVSDPAFFSVFNHTFYFSGDS